MKEVCVVPTFQREELLFLTLEAIRREDATMPLHVFSDRGDYSQDCSRVCFIHSALPTITAPHNYYGNSWNVLEACRKTLRIFPDLEILHLVEDDTILHPGYFEWARQKLGSGQFAAVCGHIGNELDTWYTSPCASWSADALRECLGLIPEGYFCETREGMQKALDDCAHFKASKFRYGSAEQDGFFLRCIEHFGWRTKFPATPLCQHGGFFGYNRNGDTLRPTGTLEERVAYCRKVLADPKQRYELFGTRITDLEMSSL